MRPGTRFTAEVADLNADGAGVVRHAGLVVFVPGAVPGDTVQVRVDRVRRGWAEGILLGIERPSPHRREAPCAHQADCGGCPLMVLEEEAALRIKARHLGEVVRRIGGIDHPVDRAVASPRALGYRGRVRFAVRPRAEGPGFGYRPRGLGDAIVPIDACLLAPPRASELARTFLERLDRMTPPGGRAWPEQIELRGSLATGEWLVVVHGPAGPWSELAAAARTFAAEHGDIAGIVRLAERPGRFPAEYLLSGGDSVRERIGGIEVELGATTFLQVNPAAAGLLYDEVRRALLAPGAPRRVLDLYCGVGLVGLLAVPPGIPVHGVELHPGSVERGVRAARRAGRDELTFAAEDAPAAAAALAAAGERVDAVVLNPPRQGAGPDLARTVRALGASSVVMVSCHPAALARDLRGFTAAGFALAELVAVDMFPQTPHLEAVARLVPAEGAGA